MSRKRDYYEVLGVSESATEQEIARAYRKLAVQYHPDSNPGDPDASARFKEAAEAYDVLCDADKRARYDRYGHAGVEAMGSRYHDAEDLFEAVSEMFGGGMFADIFGGGRRGTRRHQRGANVRVDVSLTLEEAAKGLEKTVRFSRRKPCDNCQASGSKPGSQPKRCANCGGRGAVIQSAGILRMQTTCSQCRGTGQVIVDPCEVCEGNGFVQLPVDLTVTIPPGVDDGMRVRIAGEGQPSPDGGPAGDCYCFIAVKRHKLFHRDGSNLILQMPITFPQAALGAEIRVPTLDGPDMLRVPRGTQSGEVFKLAGRGMPDPHGGRRGDLLVQTFVETPKRLSPEQEDLLRKMAELENGNVSPQRKSFLDRIKDYFSITERSTGDGSEQMLNQA